MPLTATDSWPTSSLPPWSLRRSRLPAARSFATSRKRVSDRRIERPISATAIQPRVIVDKPAPKSHSRASA